MTQVPAGLELVSDEPPEPAGEAGRGRVPATWRCCGMPGAARFCADRR